MKPDYKNWMPKGMIFGGLAITLVFLILFILFGCTGIVGGAWKTVLFIVLLLLTVIAGVITVWMVLLYRALFLRRKTSDVKADHRGRRVLCQRSRRRHDP